MSVLSKKHEVKTVYDVYYVPTLKHNLLSVGQLLGHGYEFIFHDTICTILDKIPNRALVATVKMTPNRLFPLVMRSVNMHVHHVSNTNETVFGTTNMVICHYSFLLVSYRSGLWYRVYLPCLSKSLHVEVAYLENTKEIVFQ